MNFKPEHLYYTLGILFLISALGGLYNLIMIWTSANYGVLLSVFVGIWINVLIGLGMVFFARQQNNFQISQNDVDSMFGEMDEVSDKKHKSIE